MLEMNSRTATRLGILLAFTGALLAIWSLSIAYLDSSGYWNCPKNFSEALFMNRGHDTIGFGIEGIQLFHYFIGGTALLLLGGSLLASKRIFASKKTLHIPVAELPASPENIDRLIAKIASLEHEKENLRLELSKLNRRPSMVTSYIILGAGVLSLISSILIAYSVLAFIGLGLVLWGILLMYVRPTEYARIDLLTSTAMSLLAIINDDVARSGLDGKAVYLPPTHLKDVKKGTVYFGKGEDTYPRGLYLTPLGLELTNLYERALNVEFAQVDLDYLGTNLPNLFVDILEIARKMNMKVEGNRVITRIEGSLYGNLCKRIREDSPAICSSGGCPLISSIALAIARASGNRVVIEENRVSENGQTIDVNFRLLREDKPSEIVEAVETRRQISLKFKKITYLLKNGLLLLVAGASILAWVGYLIWYDTTVWSKDLIITLFGSRTGEAIGLGIGMILGYYLLIGLLFVLAGLFLYMLRRLQVFMT
jgi:hypothetical protein